MKAFLKKELLEISWPASALFVGLCAIWFKQGSFETVLLAPNTQLNMLIVIRSTLAIPRDRTPRENVPMSSGRLPIMKWLRLPFK